MVWEIVAACFTIFAYNPKSQQEYYAKDGRRIVTYDVGASEEYRYVKKLNIEVITRSDYYRRYAKYCKILMNKAKADYDAAKTDDKLSTYNQAAAAYEIALAESRTFNRTMFTTGAGTFFGTYFPIVILLLIALLINTRIDYKGSKGTA